MSSVITPSGKLWKPLLIGQDMSSAGVSKQIDFDLSAYNDYLVDMILFPQGATAIEGSLNITPVVSSGSPTFQTHALLMADTVVSAVEQTTNIASIAMFRRVSWAGIKHQASRLVMRFRRLLASNPEILFCEYSHVSNEASNRTHRGNGTIVNSANNYTGLLLTISMASSIFDTGSKANVYYGDSLSVF